MDSREMLVTGIDSGSFDGMFHKVKRKVRE